MRYTHCMQEANAAVSSPPANCRATAVRCIENENLASAVRAGNMPFDCHRFAAVTWSPANWDQSRYVYNVPLSVADTEGWHVSLLCSC